jgi:predicted  nucleic acid-binding Zn-ribbon protein
MPEAEERFTVGCPKCGKRYVLTYSAIGKKATCKCGRSFIVEKPPEDEDDEDDGVYDVAPQ